MIIESRPHHIDLFNNSCEMAAKFIKAIKIEGVGIFKKDRCFWSPEK